MRAPAMTDPAHRALAALGAVVVLVLAGYAGLAAVRPPESRPASAPESEFSAERAFQQVQAIAGRPHPVGSPANDEVREHLLTTLRGLGLNPEVQDTVSIEGAGLSSSAGGSGLARVRNVVTVIPGTASTGRIFLVAHYDSVQVGPGGNDDAAGTSAVLETARALLAGDRPRNDVVLVLTDGEEACLCGAKAFVDQHPLARDGGVVLNLEARGSSGPAIMFETSAGNGRLVAAYGHAPKPVGTSFAVEIYRLLPNDTDFTAFRESGFAGLNAAYIDGAAVYHGPTDTPAAMDRDSLQHHGENTLAVVRELGRQDLAALEATDGDDATYFPAAGLLVRYPGSLVWPIALLALVAVAALAGLARRRGVITARRGLFAGALALVPILLAPVLAQVLWFLLKLIRPEYGAMPIDPYRPGWYRLAVVLLAAAVVIGWFALLRRRLGPAALAVAGLAWLAVLGVVLAAFVPGGSYLAALPALAGALMGLVALVTRGWLPVIAVTLSGAVATVILLPTVVMLFPALGMGLGAAGAFLTVLLGLALLPVIDLLHPRAWGQRGLEALRGRRRGALPTLATAVAVLVCAGVGLAVDRFDAQRPALTQLMYALDADTGTARWISDETAVQKWTGHYVRGDRHRVDDTLPSFGPEQVRTGDAQAADLPAPMLTVESDTSSGGVRALTLRLKPQRPVRLVTLHVAAGAPVDSATVGGRPVPVTNATDRAWGWGFVFHAPPADGVEIKLTVRAAGPVKVRVTDGSDGLSDLPGFQARPPGVGIVGSHTSELVAVAKTYTL
ncbi:M28 family peptidase [Actinoplanes sp. LDG1-06]|uniref:Vacuolar membrane protease n=1 Tax=Paractinoplanes ovalisporus TaxID=2810368 RepID=A0ABS2AI85_9ACTN|nr:M28 family peptidase [Actinoplanes ovalisporus]MBM2619073.1 M28 family peptidase [Actinoplanes ovalisporus]